MNIEADIAARHASLKAFRRDIHRHPETAFEEVRTAALVAERLEACGIEVHAGLAETGIVGVLRRVVRRAPALAQLSGKRVHHGRRVRQQ